MKKTQFLTIYATFENLQTVQKTLPSVLEETLANDAKLIIHDSSIKGREEKWRWLIDINKNDDFFLILSTNMSMAHARNMCLNLAQELYAPDYICMVEDDHGFKKNMIKEMIAAMKKYYGKISPNGLRYGLFTACGKHHPSVREILDDGNAYPTLKTRPQVIGAANSCFRCAPTSHWNNVLKGYDTDEYLISTYQTRNLNDRNYHKGFTTLILKNGNLCFDVEGIGRGSSFDKKKKLWDENYTASDPRSDFLNKAQDIKSQNNRKNFITKFLK